MPTSKDLNLSLWECGRIRSTADLFGLLASMLPLDLAPGEGAWTATENPHPVEDLARTIANPWVSDEGRRAEESGTLAVTQTEEQWVWVLAHVKRPQTRGNIFVTRRGDATWDILVSVRTFSHTLLGVTIDEFVNEWADRLERLGNIWYRLARPAVAILTATGDNEYECSAATVEQRQLVVGWRTWYGPAYARRFGRDWF